MFKNLYILLPMKYARLSKEQFNLLYKEFNLIYESYICR